jgi:hypothetical protein
MQLTVGRRHRLNKSYRDQRSCQLCFIAQVLSSSLFRLLHVCQHVQLSSLPISLSCGYTVKKACDFPVPSRDVTNHANQGELG